MISFVNLPVILNEYGGAAVWEDERDVWNVPAVVGVRMSGVHRRPYIDYNVSLVNVHVSEERDTVKT